MCTVLPTPATPFRSLVRICIQPCDQLCQFACRHCLFCSNHKREAPDQCNGFKVPYEVRKPVQPTQQEPGLLENRAAAALVAMMTLRMMGLLPFPVAGFVGVNTAWNGPIGATAASSPLALRTSPSASEAHR